MMLLIFVNFIRRPWGKRLVKQRQTLAGLAEGMWGSPDELAALWGAEARFEPELPVELTDAVYAGWQRAVDRSRDWAG